MADGAGMRPLMMPFYGKHLEGSGHPSVIFSAKTGGEMAVASACPRHSSPGGHLPHCCGLQQPCSPCLQFPEGPSLCYHFCILVYLINEDTVFCI